MSAPRLASVVLVVLSCSPARSIASGETRPSEKADPGAMRALVERFQEDSGALDRLYDVSFSAARADRRRAFLEETRAQLERIDFDALDLEGRIDRLLFADHVAREEARLDFSAEERAASEALLPYAPDLVRLLEQRRTFELPGPEASADALDALARAVESAKKLDEERRESTKKHEALRAARAADELADELGKWHRFRDGYDPAYSWWCARPEEALDKALREHATSMREKVAGLAKGDDTTIVGEPIGAERLASELRFERIAYTPDELFDIGEREMAWCQAEMDAAAKELGVATWKDALELVKRDHVEPGEQPALVRALALEAIDFVESHELVTVPPLAKETWRMGMMSADAQRRNPFFLGGEEILVSFPTASMTHEEKRMSLRGNNRWFSRAVVHHELIPGHHLQQFMTARHASWRAPFSTPFWTEGWALYWEMFLWDKGFARTPKERVGMLFWRMHRCARIRFSLGFHLGKMSEAECVDMLVERVGHERENAAAEVRRSFAGGYGPLYQCAYMIGGLELRALHAELVDSGRMTDRAFHDAILEGGNMPIELVRARLRGDVPRPGTPPSWRFYDLASKR